MPDLRPLKEFKKYDPKLAFSHLIAAANLNHRESMFQLGIMHDNGEGVQRDALAAQDWYRKANFAVAKEQRSRPAKLKITYYKMTDDGIQEMGDSEVMKRLIKKAKNGEPEVQYQLAKQYDYGKLTPRDFNKALFWYKTAAANNYEAAQFTLGHFYCRGIGVEKDAAIANQWFKKTGRGVICK